MTSSVGIVGSTQSTHPHAVPVAAVSENNSPNGTAPKALTNSNTPISPRIIVDPLAGLITQFLNATGELESQIPSAAVVAYLRAGLTTEGYAKPSPEAQHQRSEANTFTKSTNTVVA